MNWIAGRTLRGLAAVTMVAALAGLTGCSTGGNLPLTSVSQVNQGLAQGYRVGAGDKLKVTVFDEPTLTGDYQVGVGGELVLPLISPLATEGQTPEAVSQMIAKSLAEGGYVLTPRVSVEITTHRPFFILGEVKAPGEYPYSGELTLEQAVAKAGGYTPRAEQGAVVLRRQGWSQSKRVKLGESALRIAPGDTITVQEAFF